MSDQRPKYLHVQIESRLHNKLKRVIPKGLKTKVVTTVLEQICDLLDGPNSHMYLALFLRGDVSLEQLLEAKLRQDGRPQRSETFDQ